MSVLSVGRYASRSMFSLAAALVVGVALIASPQSAFAKPAPESFADIAEKLLPTVVNISTTQTIKEQRGPEMPQFPPGSPFEEFFKDFLDRQHSDRERGPRPRKATSLGSGFIIDPAGLIVTNNHVIADADEINVILHDDTVLKAKIVGRDGKTDLALLKVESKAPLPATKWGNSDTMRIGDWVLAIGNPFGLGGTVTAGIISARARDIGSGPYDDYLQTDASINRGNSGGPMFNVNGEVIGINTAIYSPSGGSVGIGFAIPATMARQVIEDLRKNGRTRRGWLGVHIQSVTDDIAESLGLKDSKGALVASITPGGPAAKSGFKPGDVVLKFDGKDVSEMKRLPRIVAETAIGKPVDVEIWRDGKRQTIKVTIGELPDDEAQPAKTGKNNAPNEGTVRKLTGLGMALATVTPELRDRLDLPDSAKGVAIVDIDPEGIAAEVGLRPGDLIVEVLQREVKDPAEVAARIEEARKAGRKSVLILAETKGGTRFVVLPLNADKPEKKDKNKK